MSISGENWGEKMYRDYTEATLNELKQQIREINESDFSPITDFFGDIWYGVQSLVGVLKIDNYLNDVSSYHRKVLDQHDTTVKELEGIFTAVRNVDAASATKLETLNNSAESYRKYIEQMAELINPSAFGFSAAAVRAQCEALSQEMQSANDDLDAVFEESLKTRKKQIAKKAAWELLQDVLSVPKRVGKFIVHVADGDVLAAGADVWGVIDDFFSLCTDLGALFNLGFACIPGIGNTIQLDLVDTAAEIRASEGLAGILAHVGCPEGLVSGVKLISTAAGLVGLFGTAKGFVGDADEASRLLGSDLLSNETKLAYMKDLLLKKLGFSFTDYNDETIIGWAKNNGGFWENLENVGKWGKSIADDTVTEQVASGFDLASIAKKAKDTVEDTTEVILPWIFGTRSGANANIPQVAMGSR